MYPEIFDEVLAVQDNATECVEAATPVPVSASVVVVGCALLVNVSVALADPAVVGLKVIVKEAVCPAGIVCGNENPLILKAELFVVAADTITLAPTALKVPVAVPLEPTVTLPSPSVAGDTLSRGVTPVPDTGMVSVGFVAVEVMVRFPLTAPAAPGANETLNCGELCPAFNVSGVVIPLTLKPAPVIATLLTDTLELPVFLMISENVP